MAARRISSLAAGSEIHLGEIHPEHWALPPLKLLSGYRE